MQEFYKILGVSESATDAEIEERYNKLKEKYSRERFYEGEIGNEAARNLTKLETAYIEIKNARAYKTDESGTVHDFSEVEKLIKDGDFAGAQARLDDITDRSAEWHYLQSVIFYKKNWINESKKQLEIALNMDPHNEKYSAAYSKLKQKMAYNENQFHSGNAQGGVYNGTGERQMGGDGANDCLSFCATWCCLNMLCNMCCRCG
ncbi:MAG: hypothetical protein J5911_02085 [Clostridia bacterium]|nr:hypothetical protein [Clostridia bacterium]